MKISERLSNLATQPAPVELRKRIVSALDAEHRLSARSSHPVRRTFSPSGTPVRWLLPVAMLAALLVVMLYPGTLPRPALPAGDSLFATALAGLPTIESFSSSDGDEVREWLQLKLGHAVEIPAIAPASLVGGRIAVLDGASVAAVAYTMHGQPLTYLTLPMASLMSKSIAEDDLRMESANGYNVAIWREFGLVSAIVSPISSREVSSVAHLCRRKAPS